MTLPVSAWTAEPTNASSTFFFYCYGHPRDLHSFPTRRSSDLSSRIAAKISRSSSFAWWSMSSPITFALPANSRLVGSQALRSGSTLCSTARCSCIAAAHRSEEHTSELQSQFHLVCRLLLEKKK